MKLMNEIRTDEQLRMLSEPADRVAVLRCKDPRCSPCTKHWIFLLEDLDHWDHSDVVADFWYHNDAECLIASVEMTTAADYLAGRSGDVKTFKWPGWDGTLEEEEETDND